MSSPSSRTTPVCGVCARKIRSQCTICHVCERTASRHLGNQAAYLGDLRTELARQVKKQPSNDGGRSNVRPLPFSPEAGELITEQARLINRWATHVATLLPARHEGPACEQCDHQTCRSLRSPRQPSTATVPAQALFVEHWLPLLRKHPDGARLVHELQRLVDRIIVVIDSPENLTRIHVGPCPNRWPDDNGHEAPCPGDVEAVVPADERKPAMMTCTACDAAWDTTQWNRTGHRIQQRQRDIARQKLLASQLAGHSA